MEGLFKYDLNMRDMHLLDRVVKQKRELKICSLSASFDNDLMWSYYANGHQGVVIELELDSSLGAKEVNYNGITHLDDILPLGNEEHIAREILIRKERYWKHEQEVRVIAASNYIPIAVKKVIIGSKVKSHPKSLLKKLLAKLGIPVIER